MDGFLWQPFVLGVALGMLGWLLYWAGLPLIGALIGTSFGGALGYLASAMVQSGAGIAIFTGLGVVLGAAAGLFLVRALQLYFFFVTGASLGGAVGYKLLASGALGLHSGSPGGWLLIAVCSVLAGLALVWGRRFIVAFFTSVIGAIIASLAFPEGWQNTAMIIALVVFLSIQIGLVRRFVDKEKFDERMRVRRRQRRVRRLERPDVDSAD